jgi:hypothetical protein
VLLRVILPDFMWLHKRTLSLFFRAVSSTFAHTFAHSGDCDFAEQLGTERNVRAGFAAGSIKKKYQRRQDAGRGSGVCVIYVPRCRSWLAVNPDTRRDTRFSVYHFAVFEQDFKFLTVTATNVQKLSCLLNQNRLVVANLNILTAGEFFR